MSETHTITKLEDIEAVLSERLDELSYISVAERVSGREEQLARLNFEPLPSYLKTGNWEPKVAEAMVLLRKELLGLADGPRSPFRVSAYGAGGRLVMRTCVVLDSTAPITSGSGSIDEVIAEVKAQGIMELSAGWKHFSTTVLEQTQKFGSMCLAQMGKVDEISRKQTELTAKETAAAREQVNTLVREVSKAKISAANAKAELTAAAAMTAVESERKAIEAERAQVGQELAKEALGKVGEFGQAFLMSKTGMSAEMLEVANALQNNPEMVEALGDPRVRDQLKNPDNLSYIAASLKQAVAVVVAQEAAVEPASEPTTSSEPASE